MQRWARVYPLLACIWSPLALAASNAGEWVQFSDLQRPLVISVAVTATLWIVAAPLTRNPDKRSFLAFLGVLAFIGGGSVLGLFMTRLAPMGLDLAAGCTLLLFTLLGTCAIVGTVYSRRSFAPTSHFLGVMTMLLVLFALVGLARAPRGRPVLVKPHLAAAPPTSVPRAGQLPTIYLIVLDKYQGSSTLRSYYGFDNTPFERALRERGFVLPVRPRANYTHTRQALSALLNWEYLDSLVTALGESASDWTPIFERVENNRAIAFLKGLGYEVVFFPNSYEPLRKNRHADLQLPDPGDIRPELETVWLHTTLLPAISTIGCKVARCVLVPGVAERPALTDWKFAQLGRLAASSRPRFVLAHLLVPHEPYVYGADCRHLPASLVWPDSAITRAAYLDQITCVNQKLLMAVDAILRTSPTPPVILLQSDHGHGNLTHEDLELRNASAAMVRGRVDIFAAYHVPGAADTLFYEGMTPVNLLPRVFNHLFGTRFQRQPDRSYWLVSAHAPYRMTPIVEEEAGANPSRAP